eukprot:TRINITY_DN1_c0_g1_i1.p1 TRINITY_DN1_c0_g1~~TRINITY_DN1_c0_g1_i1.p1  ORF type:complete len:2161 (-),score=481.62 TRINITY_DN1_c0_g1_i1:2095-8577(-)
MKAAVCYLVFLALAVGSLLAPADASCQSQNPTVSVTAPPATSVYCTESRNPSHTGFASGSVSGYVTPGVNSLFALDDFNAEHPYLVFGSDSVVDGAYVMAPGQGLQLRLPAANADHYTIAIKAKLTTLNSWRKVIDFSGLSVDAGFYLHFGVPDFLEIEDGSVTINENTVFEMVLTRDVTGVFKAYVNCQLALTENDAGQAVGIADVDGSDAVFNLFTDDVITNGEEVTGGTIYSIRVWDGPVDETVACAAFGVVTVSYLDSVTPNCASGVISRSWKATDTCQYQSSTATQIITTTDAVKPLISVVAASVSVPCDGVPIPDFSPATVSTSDDCTKRASLVITSVDVVSGDTCSKVITRTYTSTDRCGNANSASQTLTVTDSNGPAISVSDVYLQCASEVTPTVPDAVTDTCSAVNENSIQYTQEVLPGSCVDQFTIVRTFTAADVCSNQNTGIQNIIVADTTAPVLTVPAAITLECDVDATYVPNGPAGVATATDNCGGAVDITTADAITGTDCGLLAVTRTFTAVDTCGNSAIDTQVITFRDTAAPVWASSSTSFTIEVDAGCLGSVESIAAPTASDNCGDVTYTNTVVESAPGAEDDDNVVKVVTRTYVASDTCGNPSSQFVQTIRFIDTTAPTVVSVPASTPTTVGNALSCNDDISVAALGNAQFSDNCAGSITVTHSDEIVDGDCKSIIVKRSWTAVDAYGNSITTSEQLITLRDDDAPVLTVPAAASVAVGENCNADIDWQGSNAAAVGVPAATDLCDPEVQITSTDSAPTAGSCVGEKVIIRQFTATDACGNSATGSQTITLVDETAPVFVSLPADLPQYECGSGYNMAQTGTPTVSDNCDPNVVITFEDSADVGSCGEAVLTRYFVATDSCGNFVRSATPQVITVVDHTAPVITVSPANPATQVLTATCQRPVVPTTVTVADACETGLTATEVLPAVFDDNAQCGAGGVLTRKWTVTDSCGNPAEAVQSTTFVDSTPPVWQSTPVDRTLECDSPYGTEVTGLAVAVDNCNGALTVSVADNMVQSAQCGVVVIKRTFSAADACGLQITHIQTLTFQDTTNPTFTVPSAQTVNLDGSCSFASALASAAGPSDAADNCGGVTTTHTDVNGPAGCSGQPSIVTRQWTVTDACGHAVTKPQVFTIVDVTVPTFNMAGFSASVQVECGTDPSAQAIGIPSASDNCDSSVAVTYVDSLAEGDCGQVIITRVFTATDNCGLTSTLTQTITVTDNQAPFAATPAPTVPQQSLGETCSPSSAVVEGHHAASFGAPVFQDACSVDLTVTYTDVVTVNPACAASYTVVRTFVATDECNHDSAASTQTIVYVDDVAPVMTVPAAVTLNCEENHMDLQLTGQATATDSCSGSATVTYQDAFVEGSECTSIVVKRTWTAVDACGNDVSQDQLITIQDITAPTLAELPAKTVALDGDCLAFDADADAPGNLPTAFSDSCDPNPTLTAERVSFDDQGFCGSQGIATNRYTVTDACGNSVSQEQQITVLDLTPPTFSSFDINSADPEERRLADIIAPTRSLPCTAAMAGLAVSAADLELLATDNCDIISATYEDTLASSSDCGQTVINRVFTAKDVCGTVAATLQQVITITDTVAPTFNVPAAATVYLDASCALNAAPSVTGYPTGIFEDCDVLTDSTYAAAVDVAGSEHGAFYTDSFVAAGNGRADGVITRTWTVADACGNSASQVQTIQVVDNSPPTFTSTPAAELTKSCEESLDESSLGSPIAADNCGVPTVSVASTVVDGECSTMQLVRTWTVTDAAGNTAQFTQTTTVQDLTAPVFGAFGDYSATLDESCTPISTDVSVTGVPTVSDNCAATGDIDVTYVDGAHTDCGAATSFDRVFTATDLCGNSATLTQHITISDITPPVFTAQATDKTVDCGDSVAEIPTETVASDSCGVEVTYSHVDIIAVADCSDVLITRTFTATDSCNNAAQYTQYITVRDQSDPILSGIVDVTLTAAAGECAVDTSVSALASGETPVMISASDKCDGSLTPTYVDSDVSSCSAESHSRSFTRTWTAVDSCGHSVSASQVISVVDDQAPVVTAPADRSIECDDPTFMEGVATATDNCNVASSVNTFEDVDITAGECSEVVIRRRYSVTDECGNSASADQLVTVTDTTAPTVTAPANVAVTVDSSCGADTSANFEGGSLAV